MPITILDLAKARGARSNPDGSMSGQAFYDVGLDIMGGCDRCGASIAAYNACPTRSGFWRCRDCVGPTGFETTAEAEAFLTADDEAEPVTPNASGDEAAGYCAEPECTAQATDGAMCGFHAQTQRELSEGL